MQFDVERLNGELLNLQVNKTGENLFLPCKPKFHCFSRCWQINIQSFKSKVPGTPPNHAPQQQKQKDKGGEFHRMPWFGIPKQMAQKTSQKHVMQLWQWHIEEEILIANYKYVCTTTNYYQTNSTLWLFYCSRLK